MRKKAGLVCTHEASLRGCYGCHHGGQYAPAMIRSFDADRAARPAARGRPGSGKRQRTKGTPPSPAGGAPSRAFMLRAACSAGPGCCAGAASFRRACNEARRSCPCHMHRSCPWHAMPDRTRARALLQRGWRLMAHLSCACRMCSKCVAVASCVAAPACLPGRPGSHLPDQGHAVHPITARTSTRGRQLEWSRPPGAQQAARRALCAAGRARAALARDGGRRGRAAAAALGGHLHVPDHRAGACCKVQGCRVCLGYPNMHTPGPPAPCKCLPTPANPRLTWG